MATSHRGPLKFGAGFAALFLVALIAGGLTLPGFIQKQAQQFVAEKSGHRLTLAPPELDLFRLAVRLRDLRLETPEGKQLLAFRELLVDVAAKSVIQRTLIFDTVQVDGLAAAFAVGGDGRLNWTPLIDALRDKEPKPETSPPRIDIEHFKLAGARIDVADERAKPAFSTRIEPLDIELTDVSTLPDDSGRVKLAATTTFGAKLAWEGSLGLNPLGSEGRVAFEDVDLARLLPLIREHAAIPALAGVAALAADYRLFHADGKPRFALDKIDARLKGFALQLNPDPAAPRLAADEIALPQARFESAANTLEIAELTLSQPRIETKQGAAPLKLGNVSVKPIRVDLGTHQAAVGAVRLQGGAIAARRDAAGAIDLLVAFKALVPPPTAEARAAEGAAPWRYRIDRVALDGFDVALRDDGSALELALGNLALGVEGVSDNLGAPLPLRASFDVKSGGRFEANAKLVPAEATLEGQFKLANLALKPVAPLVSRFVALDLVGGAISAQGRIAHNAKESRYRGGFALNDLNLVESGTDRIFLAWKALSIRELDATPSRLEIPELALDGLDTQLLIDKDKTLNAKRLLKKSDAPAAANDEPPPVAVAAAPAPPSFVAHLGRLRLTNAELDFADQSLLFPFATRVHRLRGTINGLSSQPGVPGQVELEGQVDDYGLARVAGELDFFDPTGMLDLKVNFRNLEMTRLTPYMATFAGRKIDSGRLSLNLDYQLKRRQLESHNQLIIDRLALGERVDSPGAANLPLDLAIALLEDSDGRIDLGMPITGSLDDPQFSYGHLIWKVIGNVLSKIVTAPFRALASLFGGGGEAPESVVFEAGAGRLTPPEREKLAKLAGALGKRPNLTLTMQPVWVDADRVTLQDRQLRRQLLDKGEAAGETRGDPGPVSTRQPQIQTALETLFAARFGDAELAALKEGFRRANPGQLEEGAARRMMSKLTNLWREQRTLDESEVDRLKGADFHTTLYDRLREKENITDEQLRQLARRRGENALTELKNAGAPLDRVRMGEPGRAEVEGREAPLRMSLGAAE